MQDVLQEVRKRAFGTRVHVLDDDQVVIDGVRYLGCTLWTDFELRIDSAFGTASDAATGIEAARRSMMDYQCINIVDGPSQHGHEPARRRLRPEDTLSIHRQQRERLRSSLEAPFEGLTVVVTHTAPHRGSLSDRFAGDWTSTAFVNELPQEFFKVPTLWVHWHTHASFDYRVGTCRVVANPRGYLTGRMKRPENLNFDDALVVTLP